MKQIGFELFINAAVGEKARAPTEDAKNPAREQVPLRADEDSAIDIVVRTGSMPIRLTHQGVISLEGEMKVKITLDRWGFSNSDVLSEVLRELGSNVTISGNEIVVQDDWNERRVTDLLNRRGVKYSRESAWW